MTAKLIVHLLAQARRVPPPKEFVVRQDQVDVLAHHMRQTMTGDIDMDSEPLRDQIVSGRVKLLGIPVRVLGVKLAPKIGEP